MDEDIDVNADHADLNPNFQIQRYSSSPDLVEAIGETIADFKKADLMPILVCDIDETLVYKVWQSTASYHIPTSFSKGLEHANFLRDLWGVLALTARPVKSEGILDKTLKILEESCPNFYESMTTTSKNAFNLPEPPDQTYLDPAFYLHKNGLLIMGKTCMTKFQTLCDFFRKTLLQNSKYGLIYIDNIESHLIPFETRRCSTEIKNVSLFQYLYEHDEDNSVIPYCVFKEYDGSSKKIRLN